MGMMREILTYKDREGREREEVRTKENGLRYNKKQGKWVVESCKIYKKNKSYS